MSIYTFKQSCTAVAFEAVIHYTLYTLFQLPNILMSCEHEVI